MTKLHSWSLVFIGLFLCAGVGIATIPVMESLPNGETSLESQTTTDPPATQEAVSQQPSGEGMTPTTSGETDTISVNLTSAVDGTREVGDLVTPSSIPAIYNSPYSAVTLRVAIEYEHDALRDKSDEVDTALEFWENHALTYAGYPVVYERVDNPNDADVLITFEEMIERCGAAISELSVGCATFVEDTAPEQVEIRVEADRTAQGTTDILIHELGHTLGLDHDDEPHYYMQATIPLAIDRPEVGVQIGGDGVDTGTRSQVESALEYLETHPELEDPPAFTFIDDPVAVDLFIHVEPPDPYWHCSIPEGSCLREGGYELKDQFHFATRGIDTAALGWHLGFHLSDFLFEERPSVLSEDASYQERRSEWWE